VEAAVKDQGVRAALTPIRGWPNPDNRSPLNPTGMTAMNQTSSSGVEIRIEPRDFGGGFASATSKQAALIKEALPQLGEALKEPIDNLFTTMMTGMRQPPDEIELELGLAFEGGANWVVVSVGAEATLALTLKFKPGDRTRGAPTK
jgi:hypothetical protein